MVKILLVNAGCLQNPGIGMMLKAIVSCMGINAEFYAPAFTVCRGYDKYGVKYTWKLWGYDVALDLGGDTFTRYYGLTRFLQHAFYLFLLWLVRQKYAIFSQTLSEYTGLTRGIARFFLSRALFITVREFRSLQVLSSCGINGTLAADIAFLLRPGFKSQPYAGGSYHRIIGAMLAGQPWAWDGSRGENFKFDIFTLPLASCLFLKVMRKRAWLNVKMLCGILKN